jgi:glycosyltransferase involved in cell wall biosynthesis
LAEAGFDVTYITSHDKTEQRDGVTIRGVPKARTRLQRLTRVLPAVIRAAFAEKGDIYHFHDVELLLAGFLLKLTGKKVIYDVHENYPADVFREKPYIPAWIRHALSGSISAAEWTAGWWFDGVVAATGLIGARFPKRKTVVVRNYARVAELQSGVEGLPYAQRAPLALFTGGLTPIRCAEEMCSMSDALRDIPGYATVVVGRPNTPSYADELSTVKGWDVMRFEGIVPMSRVRTLLGEARVALCLNRPRADFLDLATNKLFEYMAVGLPVVSTDIPYWRELIERTGCGIVVNGSKEGDLSAAVRWLLENPIEAEAMGAKGKAAAEELYDWSSEGRQLLSVYRRLLNKP